MSSPGDALDPGPEHDFPYCRDEDGYLDVQRVPVGVVRQRGPDGRPVLIDLTPSVRTATGELAPITAVVPLRPVP